ncbi:class D beta-lactamase [Acinetobacter sp. NIPH 2699]|uniref:class D beta-lactamase n=1 Tax=Acinetobacter sp. NIPH 2699 TaxID=2923433 RepID=UPI001F4A8DB0|nr:class D beta-lactamase [Acinetobacter sp. NIPH 2699]MCH7335739.1 class D beta-lactamase [Acinetobacter sp. NIPH 2699]
MSKMLKHLTLCASLTIGLTLVGCQNLDSRTQTADLKKDDQTEIAALFQHAQTVGVFLTYDGQTLREYGNDLGRANTAYIPASTFKILNALIGIQHHKSSPNEVFKWNGKKRAFVSWEKDLTLAEAMQASAVPVYQELARRIGLELMANEVKRVGFGNAEIGTQVDDFWLVGPLKITPVDEVKFAYALANKQLPFEQTVQQQVKHMVLVDDVQGTKIYAKSGWGMDVVPQVGWWTGWIEQPDGKITAFSLNMEMNKPEHADARKAIVYQALQQLNLLPK